MKKISILTALIVAATFSMTGLAMAQSVEQTRGASVFTKAYGVEVTFSEDGLNLIAAAPAAATPEIKEWPPVESID